MHADQMGSFDKSKTIFLILNQLRVPMGAKAAAETSTFIRS